VNFLEVVQKVVDTFWKRVYGESGFIFFDSILFGFIMSSSDSLGVHFTGKNYSAQEFQFHSFVRGKNCRARLMGVIQPIWSLRNWPSGRSRMHV
jgi:hypothetical protein